MAQIVYDVAADAGLPFPTAFGGEADFAQGILDLAAAGSTIIVDDVVYFAEPMFHDGVIALGIPHFCPAGNNGRETYEAAFIDSGVTGPAGGMLHDFDPGPGVVHPPQDPTERPDHLHPAVVERWSGPSPNPVKLAMFGDIALVDPGRASPLGHPGRFSGGETPGLPLRARLARNWNVMKGFAT